MAAKGMYVAIASTIVETSDPKAELQPAFQLMGPIMDRFDSVSEIYAPVGDGTADGCYISESYDATSHFETTSEDIISLYRRITKKDLDLTVNAGTSILILSNL